MKKNTNIMVIFLLFVFITKCGKKDSIFNSVYKLEDRSYSAVAGVEFIDTGYKVQENPTWTADKTFYGNETALAIKHHLEYHTNDDDVILFDAENEKDFFLQLIEITHPCTLKGKLWRDCSNAFTFTHGTNFKNNADNAWYGNPIITINVTTPGTTVVITGLKFRGPGHDYDPDLYINEAIRIALTNTANVEIYNCEFYDWPWRGIGCSAAQEIVSSPPTSPPYSTVNIHHCYFHSNWVISSLSSPEAKGLGYGIDVEGNAHPRIHNNRFEDNRHAIAADPSTPEYNDHQGYHADHNWVVSNPFAHAFDMHGLYHYPLYNTTSNTQAGNHIVIFNNVFNYDYATLYDGNGCNPYIEIRGLPTQGCEIYDNKFGRERNDNSQYCPIRQCYLKTGSIDEDDWENANPPFGRMSMSGNEFYSETPKTGMNVSWSGYHPWYPVYKLKDVNLAKVIFIDYEGDGDTEAFKAESGKWYMIPFYLPLGMMFDSTITNPSFDWREVRTSSYDLSNIGFGRFDDFYGTDVYRIHTDGEIRITHSPTSLEYNYEPNWNKIGTLAGTVLYGKTATTLLEGDFNGDKLTDLLGLYNGKCYILLNFNGSFEKIPIIVTGFSAIKSISDLRVGDFIGDNCDDLLYVDTNTNKLKVAEAYVVGGAVKFYSYVNLTSDASPGTLALSKLLFGNFALNTEIPDLKTDILFTTGTKWSVLRSENKLWYQWQSQSSILAINLRVADLNGDGRSDVISSF